MINEKMYENKKKKDRGSRDKYYMESISKENKRYTKSLIKEAVRDYYASN